MWHFLRNCGTQRSWQWVYWFPQEEIGFHSTYEMSYLFSSALGYMLLWHITLACMLGSIYELSTVFHWSICLNQYPNIIFYAWTQGNYDISKDLWYTLRKLNSFDYTLSFFLFSTFFSCELYDNFNYM